MLFHHYFFSEQTDLLIVINISLLSFLYLNYHSKVFFGDNGTHLLGFVIAYLVINTAQNSDYILLTADKIFMIMILPGIELIRLFSKEYQIKDTRFHLIEIIFTIYYLIISKKGKLYL